MDLRDMIKLNNQLGKDLIVDGLLYFIDDDKVCVEVCDMQIERADILKGTEIITDCAFKSCKNLVTVNIPEGVTDIQDNAFYGCKSLKKIDLPNGVLTIGVAHFVVVHAY